MLKKLSNMPPVSVALLLGALFMSLILLRGVIQAKFTYDQNAERWLGVVSADLVKLSAYIDQNFDTSFLLLDSVVQLADTKGIETADELRAGMSGPALHQTLKDRISALPHIDVLAVIADNGEIINSTRSYPPPKINLADRDYFLEALQGDHQGVKRRISVPIRNRVNGTWTFYISHKLTGNKGQFIGMVVVGLRSSFFSDFFEQIHAAPGSTISLFRDDYLLLSRWPRDEQLLGDTFRNGAMPSILKNNPSGAGVMFYGGPRFSDPSVNDRRLVGVRRLERSPGLLTVTVPEKTYLKQWWELAWNIVAATVLGLTVAGLFLWLFVRLLKRREADVVQLSRLKQRAEEASMAKSEFLSAVSHELRTPLNGLLGFSELLKGTQLNREQQEFADMIHTSSLQLRDIINHVLDMSTIEAGEMAIHESQFSPRELAAGVAALYAQNARVKNLTLEFEAAENLPVCCLGDPLRLRQVLSNLVNNAIKFTEAGRVQVVAGGWSAEPGKYSLRLEVFDTGIGIDEAALKGLFEPFKQVDSSLSRRYEGAGLGLSISKKLVELMQGRIGVNSRCDLGSLFWVEIELTVVESSPQEN